MCTARTHSAGSIRGREEIEVILCLTPFVHSVICSVNFQFLSSVALFSGFSVCQIENSHSLGLKTVNSSVTGVEEITPEQSALSLTTSLKLFITQMHIAFGQ